MDSDGKGVKQLSVDFLDILKKSFPYFQDHEKVSEYLNKNTEEIIGQGVSDSLFEYTTNILDIVNSDKVPSSIQVKFIEKIELFSGLLHLKVFKSENRKTKKVIVKHLSNLLAASFKYAKASIFNSSFDKILKSNNSDTVFPPNLNPMELMSDGKLMDMFSQNTELSSMVTRMTSKLMESKVDPMQLLGSIMSGNTQSGVVKDLFSDIENDIKKMDPEKLEGITKGIDDIISKK